MAKRNHPRRGSMAFSPRKRANRPFGHVKSWPTTDASEVRVQGFAGWKAGMTHILARDMNPRSTSAGQETRIPVTVVECPKMRILGVRGYEMTPYGKQAKGEVWADAEKIAEAFSELFKRLPARKEHDAEKHMTHLKQSDLCEVRLIVATQPNNLSSVPTKIPDVMEMGLTGGTADDQLDWASERLGEEYSFTDAFEEGALTDIIAVTKGYGWQGVIKRFGGKLQSHKNSKKRRQHGNMGAFGDGYVRKTIRQGGQTGYHQRTEYNKRVLRVANPDDHAITPAGGFLHYGEVKSEYILVKGSVPGPAKRLIRFRDATRGSDRTLHDYEITYVSTASKQGA
ncbi:MAG: 50S ribosomal protein L3 [Candidatus Poseidoniales archaeon]|nr:MAG: 50S ribosomal protein L3 [Candidatus Poseidoniales archaeon]